MSSKITVDTITVDRVNQNILSTTKYLNKLKDDIDIHSIYKSRDGIVKKAEIQDQQTYTKLRNDAILPNVSEKIRIAEINNKAFLEKQLLVNRLMYVIFFILYSIILGVFLGLKVISKQTLVITFCIGIVYLLYSLFSSTKFLKLYGDISMDIAKGATKGLITIVGDIEECPADCVLHKKHKKVYVRNSSTKRGDDSDDSDDSTRTYYLLPDEKNNIDLNNTSFIDNLPTDLSKIKTEHPLELDIVNSDIE
jgi:hypothetical protein